VGSTGLGVLTNAPQDAESVSLQKKLAAIGALVFFLAGPGVVAGVIPWRLTRWRARRPAPGGVPARAAGAVLVGGGALVLSRAFARFVVEGVGTPLPIAAPQHLVVGGVYRHVRNPMYLALGATVLGQALLLGRPVLLLYAAGGAVPVVAFVRRYEEPTLLRRFGDEYEDYRRNVPRWRPRLRAWLPPNRAADP
jgi:protein-S-isoprenylcysteine O-methyltransferase Ste14